MGKPRPVKPAGLPLLLRCLNQYCCTALLAHHAILHIIYAPGNTDTVLSSATWSKPLKYKTVNCATLFIVMRSKTLHSGPLFGMAVTRRGGHCQRVPGSSPKIPQLVRFNWSIQIITFTILILYGVR